MRTITQAQLSALRRQPGVSVTPCGSRPGQFLVSSRAESYLVVVDHTSHAAATFAAGAL